MKTPLIKSWLGQFLLDHIALHPGDWPRPDSPRDAALHRTWLRALIEVDATRAETIAASKAMADGEPIMNHPSLVVDLVLALRRQAMEASERAAAANSRETAEIASRHCPLCGGGGYATLYDRRYDGRRVAELPCVIAGEITRRPFPMVVAGHCRCPLGRWMRSKVDEATRRGIPDVEAVLSGGTRWVLEDPTYRDAAEEACAAPAGSDSGGREAVKAMAGDLAGDLAERGVGR